MKIYGFFVERARVLSSITSIFHRLIPIEIMIVCLTAHGKGALEDASKQSRRKGALLNQKFGSTPFLSPDRTDI